MSKRKGIILAGGSATRLYPITLSVSKQLMPVYDKPLIYYSLSCLMLAKIREILIISTERDIIHFKELLGDGSKWGLSIDYHIQYSPDGIAQAMILAENFLNNDPSVLILGDNLFYGNNLASRLENANNKSGATIFVHQVKNPQDYGVAVFDNQGIATNLVEKPNSNLSNWAVTGLYFYDCNAPKYAKELKPSKRGELEITDLNFRYLTENNLNVETLGRGYSWLDTGTHDNLLEASNFISTIQRRQGHMICSPEEIAYRNNWINDEDLIELSESLKKTDYGKYLLSIISNK
tara:strand:- start:9558 stop:10433 length:876 start_codon:yes stop_codon:yes gene_type:complete